MSEPHVRPPVETLTDQQAITVLRLVLEHERLLPDAFAFDGLEAQVREATGQPIDSGPTVRAGVEVGGPVTEGALAREALAYLLTSQPQLAGVVDRAITMAQEQGDGLTRFEPITVGAGVLVVLALQTEVQLERGTNGKWRFKLHKKAMSDSTLGKLLTKLITTYTGGTGT